jgi:hypothetical protein
VTKHPNIGALRDSFNRVYHGPDRLRREYELTMEAERLGVHIDTYRRLYELRGKKKSTLTLNLRNGGTLRGSGELAYGTYHPRRKSHWGERG